MLKLLLLPLVLETAENVREVTSESELTVISLWLQGADLGLGRIEQSWISPDIVD